MAKKRVEKRRGKEDIFIYEVLRDFAMEHNWVATDFGCSFFPTEPEHRVTFEALRHIFTAGGVSKSRYFDVLN